MKYTSQKLGILIALFLYSSCIKATIENSINLFLQSYPLVQIPEKLDDKYSEALQQPGYLHAKILENRFTKHGVAGIFGIYQGYITLSDKNGEIMFPRKQQSNTLNLLVTPEVIPAFIIPAHTVHHWELNPDINTDSNTQAMYSISLDHDGSSDAYFYNVKSIPLPSDNVIDFSTAILLAPANTVFIPEGITMANYSPNLILPPIYIKPGIQFTHNALYTLKIKQYFERINRMYKQPSTSQPQMPGETSISASMILENE